AIRSSRLEHSLNPWRAFATGRAPAAGFLGVIARQFLHGPFDGEAGRYDNNPAGTENGARGMQRSAGQWGIEQIARQKAAARSARNDRLRILPPGKLEDRSQRRAEG